MKNESSAPVRLDKFLWAARFFKTRQLAQAEIELGRVQVNGADAKASKEVKVGDTIALRQGQVPRTVVVQALSATRGPAPVAQTLYQETPDSITSRERIAEQRRLQPEPAAALSQGRPTKRDRRDLNRWDDRWSASVD
jgi:ribosome-associated heat shock protein Hsp15